LQQQQQALERRMAELYAQRQALMQELAQERQRVAWYLTFVDQILQMERFVGQRDQAGAWQALAGTRQRLYYQSFIQQEGAAMLADHQAKTNRHFQAVSQSLANVPQAAGAQGQQYLAQAWQQYTQKIARGEDVTPELQMSLQVFAWSKGYPHVPPEFDYFTGTQQRVAAALSQAPAEAARVQSTSLENDIDRPGLDYRAFDLPEPRPELCQAECARESTCRAFTYVKPGYQGSQGRCWLKASVPEPTPNPCCISGVK
jgi:hypothetical protein